MLSARIWGSRGSIPCPGGDTVVFGGNTSCIEIRADDRIIIVDMGSGIRALGDRLMAEDFKRKKALDIDIFITHTHWDHIMGFPMFSPIFNPAINIRLYCPLTYDGENPQAVLGVLLSHRYWPVRLSELAAKIEYQRIGETALDLGQGLRVTSKYLNHPVLCLGYRIEYEGKSIVTAFDTEPFYNLFPTDPAAPGYDEEAALDGAAAVLEAQQKLLRFFQGADALICDSQYTDEEYRSKRGWGHSTYEQAAVAAREAGVKKLICFHHDPARTDTQLAQLERHYQTLYRDGGTEISMACEGMVIET
ncbi:MAG: MBL fold metallo-hydrolase [Treponema sp.]|jgi:phosphoribosyl 1,2-cyclic phosphodiesterase|nr:MBL fold metallo-hydrolase [Treponema sp.]